MTKQSPLPAGTAGASARSSADRLQGELERRRAARGPFGRTLASLFPSSEEQQLLRKQRSWRTGAGGEEILARSLAHRCPGVPVLHDRRAPMRQGNIDHIVFAPTGVYVIDCKRHTGKIKVMRPLFGPARLMINGRNRSQHVAGLARHVADVREALAGLADGVPVYGCFCFVAPERWLAETGLPLLRTLAINGYPLYTPRPLARRLRKHGPLTKEKAAALALAVAERLPPASPA